MNCSKPKCGISICSTQREYNYEGCQCCVIGVARDVDSRSSGSYGSFTLMYRLWQSGICVWPRLGTAFNMIFSAMSIFSSKENLVDKQRERHVNFAGFQIRSPIGVTICHHISMTYCAKSLDVSIELSRSKRGLECSGTSRDRFRAERS